jgi:hypothetical protein
VDEKRSDKNRERVSSERLKHEGSGPGQEMGAAVRSPGKAWWEERKESSREHSDAVASRFSTSGFVRFTSLLCAVQTDRAAASYSLPLPRPITRTRISNGRQIRSGHLPSTKDAASMPPCRPLVAGRFRQSTYPSHRSDPSSCHARNRQSAPRIQNHRIRENMTHKEDCSPWRSARPPAGRHTSPAVVALDEKREEVDDGVSEAGRSGELTDICLVTDGEEKGVPGAAAVFKGPAKGPHPTWLRLSSSS